MPPAVVDPVVKPEAAPLPKKDKEASNASPDRARLIVQLPADAKLFIDEQLMKTGSDKRTFNTPVLTRDQTYYYMLRVEATRDGQPITETKRVILKAGEVVRADFSAMDAVTTAKAR
jgi:uncharacterized protein (TIGR03000 family)